MPQLVGVALTALRVLPAADSNNPHQGLLHLCQRPKLRRLKVCVVAAQMQLQLVLYLCRRHHELQACCCSPAAHESMPRRTHRIHPVRGFELPQVATVQHATFGAVQPGTSAGTCELDPRSVFQLVSPPPGSTATGFPCLGCGWVGAFLALAAIKHFCVAVDESKAKVFVAILAAVRQCLLHAG